jgi:hypothetical protein
VFHDWIAAPGKGILQAIGNRYQSIGKAGCRFGVEQLNIRCDMVKIFKSFIRPNNIEKVSRQFADAAIASRCPKT